MLVRVEPDELDQLAYALTDPGLRPAEEAGHCADVVGHAHVRKQTDVLDHVTHLPAQLDRIQAPNALPVDEDVAFGHVDQAVDHLHRGRLAAARSEEHTSELQSRQYLVCRLLLEKKKQHPEAEHRLRHVTTPRT